MNNITTQLRSGKQAIRIIFIGLCVSWIASITLALQIKKLLTSSNYPQGTDPSFDEVLAFLFLLLFIFGLWLALRTWLDSRNRLSDSLHNTFRTIGLCIVVLFVLSIIIEVFLVSAGLAFAKNAQPLVVNEPSPSDSLVAFPTPINLEPTPAYDPAALFMSGNITSALDGLRVGDMSVNVAASGQSIESIQVHLFRIACTIQSAQGTQTEAVDEHKLYIEGPIPVNEGSFFASQNQVVIHGVFSSSTSLHGTLYLSYTDPQNQQTCDLGNFDWEVNPLK